MLRWIINVEWPVDFAVAFLVWFLGSAVLLNQPITDAASLGLVGVFYYAICWPMVKIATGFFAGTGFIFFGFVSWSLAIAILIAFGVLYYSVHLLSRHLLLPILRSLSKYP